MPLKPPSPPGSGRACCRAWVQGRDGRGSGRVVGSSVRSPNGRRNPAGGSSPPGRWPVAEPWLGGSPAAANLPNLALTPSDPLTHTRDQSGIACARTRSERDRTRRAAHRRAHRLTSQCGLLARGTECGHWRAVLPSHPLSHSTHTHTRAHTPVPPFPPPPAPHPRPPSPALTHTHSLTSV